MNIEINISAMVSQIRSVLTLEQLQLSPMFLYPQNSFLAAPMPNQECDQNAVEI